MKERSHDYRTAAPNNKPRRREATQTAPPPDAELVAAFRKMGAHVHLYECQLDGGGGDEVVPFEYAPERVS